MKAIILTNNTFDANRVFVSEVKQKISAFCDLYDKVLSKKDILDKKNFDDVQIIFSTWGMPNFSKEEISEYFPNLKYLFYAAGSVQTFAEEFLQSGVRVFSAWRLNAIPVVEYTLSAILMANKGLFRMTKKGTPRFVKFDFLNKSAGNYNTNVGLLGCGSVGSMVAEKLKNFDLNVYCYDPFLSDERAEQLGVVKKDLDWIFANCRVVSNHLANKKELNDIINYKLLKSMPKYSTFINTGRGAQVSESGLVKAFIFNLSKYALLDVTKKEPLSIFSPLRYMKNVVLTPHIAGSASGEVVRMADGIVNVCREILAGKAVDCEVTLDMLTTMA